MSTTRAYVPLDDHCAARMGVVCKTFELQQSELESLLGQLEHQSNQAIYCARKETSVLLIRAAVAERRRRGARVCRVVVGDELSE